MLIIIEIIIILIIKYNRKIYLCKIMNNKIKIYNILQKKRIIKKILT